MNISITPFYIFIFLGIFLFLRYFIRDANVLFFLIVSLGCVYYYVNNIEVKKEEIIKNNENKKDYNRIELEDDLEKLVENIKKYDSNNLIYILKKNIRNLYRAINRDTIDRVYLKNDIDTIFYLKKKILENMSSLNINYDDAVIDNTVLSVKSIIENDIDKFKESLRGSVYYHFFDNIDGFNIS